MVGPSLQLFNLAFSTICTTISSWLVIVTVLSTRLNKINSNFKFIAFLFCIFFSIFPFYFILLLLYSFFTSFLSLLIAIFLFHIFLSFTLYYILFSFFILSFSLASHTALTHAMYVYFFTFFPLCACIFVCACVYQNYLVTHIDYLQAVVVIQHTTGQFNLYLSDISAVYFSLSLMDLNHNGNFLDLEIVSDFASTSLLYSCSIR